MGEWVSVYDPTVAAKDRRNTTHTVQKIIFECTQYAHEMSNKNTLIFFTFSASKLAVVRYFYFVDSLRKLLTVLDDRELDIETSGTVVM